MKYPYSVVIILISPLLMLTACNDSSSSRTPHQADPATYTAASADDDFAVTEKNQAISIAATDNDHAHDASSFQISDVDATSTHGGTIERQDDGTLSYAPASDFTGNDYFRYEITDNRGQSDSAYVYINVRNPELPPECAQDREAKKANGEPYCIEGTIKSFDNTSIAFQLFVPAPLAVKQVASEAGADLGPMAPGFSPLLIHAHGFGDSKTEEFLDNSPQIDKQIAYDAWQTGYWVISYTQRGFGGGQGADETPSGGAIGMMNPALEGLDFVRLVDWAVCHLRADFDPTMIDPASPADPEADNCGASLGTSLIMSDTHQRLSGFDDNPSLGTIGYSYGGAAQFNAQSVDTRVDAMVPMGTWYDLRFSLHPNDAPKTSWIEIMTAFALQGSNGEEQGSNGEPVPDLIIEGNQQANTANLDENDSPHNKQRQVSVKNHNILGPNGTIGYCDGNQGIAEADSLLADHVSGPVFENHPFVTSERAARADLLMIQGHGDTLFNMNEGYDNVRCFAEQNTNLDVRYISQTSGHPLPDPIGPPHYAGMSQSMYLDEIIHCNNINGQPQRYNLREVGFGWFEDKLRGVQDFNSLFPHKLCVTQPNTDPTLVLDTNDPFYTPNFSDTNISPNCSEVAYQFPREGVSTQKLSDFMIGGTETQITGPFLSEGVTLVTGPNPNPDALPTNELCASNNPRCNFVELYSVDSSQVLAGIPLAKLKIARDNLLNDEIFYIGIAVKRCKKNPYSPEDPLAIDGCELDAPLELLQFQAMPVRVFPTLQAEIESGAAGPSELANYPAMDPRNTLDELGKTPHVYPICWGTDPANAAGRLIGISARLHPGDKVGLMLLAEHPVFTSLTSPEVGSINVSGKVWLPLHPPSTPPMEQTAYMIQAPDPGAEECQPSWQ